MDHFFYIQWFGQMCVHATIQYMADIFCKSIGGQCDDGNGSSIRPVKLPNLAFIIDTNLFLYEHQSTYNPNMPLRDLFYISGEYQKLVDRWTNCLSESYENQQGEPNLELKVVTININRNCNRKLMEQCRILGEYAQYVEKVRKNAETMSLDVAVKEAVDECIQKGILADFLRVNRAEVIAMSIFEYDKEEEEQKLQATYEKQGELKKAKSIAISLVQEGESIERIARILGETEKTIKEWLAETH